MTEIQEISHYIQSCDNSMERDNIYRDLSLMMSRIKSGEYRDTDFSARNQFDTLRRTYEFFNYLIGYSEQAKFWQALIKQVDLDSHSRVCDLCPGSAPKVELALIKENFSGTLVIADQDPIANHQMKIILDIFSPCYTYSFKERNVFSLKSQYDLITANHVFDDLLLYEYSQSSRLSLRDLYESEPLFSDITMQIMNNKECALNMMSKVYKLIKRCLKKKGYFMMTHYLGLTESALNLLDWSIFVYRIMREIFGRFIDEQYQIIDKHLPSADQYRANDQCFFILQNG